MKGERTIDGHPPWRFVGLFFKNYYWDVEEWLENYGLHEKKCYVCGGTFKNTRINGNLLKHNFPYMACYKAFKGKEKGFSRFHLICRACAYGYGLGVIEKDGNLYRNYYDFIEKWVPPEERNKDMECPNCGGALSERRFHKGKAYRHCYSCHFEYYEEGDNS